MIDPITFIRVIFLLAFSVSVPSVFAISIYAQDVTITGRVTDESGLPVAGAMIDAFALPERDLGVGETDENGHFRVEGSGLSSENCESSDPQKSCWLAAYCGPVKGRFFGKSTTLFHISPNSPRPLTMNIDMVCHWVSGSSLQTEPDPYPDDSNRRNATERTSLPHADPTAQTRTSQKATDPTFTEQAGGSPAAIRTHPDSSASTSNAHKEGISASRADNPLIQQEDHPVIANMVVRTGHAGLIQQMAFSADGDLLGTWSADGALIIWRTDNLHERTRFQPRTEMGVPVFAFSSGGLLVAEGSEVACYSLETNSKRSVLASLPSRVMDFQTSPNGAWLAYTDDDRAVRLVSLSSAKRSQVLVLKPPTENEDFGIQLAFNQSSSRLAVAEPNGKIEVYALSADSVWQVHQETLEFTPRTLGFDPSDTLWLFGVAPSQDDDVRAVLYAEIPTLVKYTTPAHTSAISVPFNVTGMRFGGSSKTLLLMGRHDVDNAWKDNTGGLPEGIKVVSPPTPWMSPGLVTAAEAAFSLADGGEYVATGDYQDQLAIWEIATRTKRVIPKGEVSPVSHIELASTVPFLVVSHRNHLVNIWDLDKGEQVQQFAIPNWEFTTAHHHSWMAFFNLKGELVLFDLLTGLSQKPGLVASSETGSIKFLDDDETVVWVDKVFGGAQETLKIWKIGSEDPPRVLCHLDNWSDRIELSSTNRLLAARCISGETPATPEATRPAIYVWTLPSLRPRLIDGDPEAMSFTPDDQFLLIATPRLESVNLATGKREIWEPPPDEEHSLNQPRQIELANNSIFKTIAVSPDERFAYVGHSFGGSGVDIWSDWKSPLRQKTGLLAALAKSTTALSAGKNHDLWLGSEDGTVYLIRDNTSVALALVSLSRSGWASATTLGLFDGNADAIRWIGWRKDGAPDFTPADTFFNTFYYPGLLASVVNGKEPAPPRQTIGDLLDLPGLNYLLDIHLATLEDHGQQFGLCLPAAPTSDLLDQIKLTLKGDRQKINTDEFNSTTRPGCRYFKPLSGDLRSYELNSRSAADEPNIAEASSPVPVHKQLTGATIHVQTVTFDKYSYFDPLRFPSSDGKAIRDFFSTEAFPSTVAGPAVKIWDPLEDGTTVEQIRARLKEIGRSSKPQDTILLFFSGHGTVLTGQQMYFFVTNGVAGKDNDSVRAASVNSAMFADAIREMNADRVLLVLDSCQSGGVLDSLKRVADAKSENRRKQRGDVKGENPAAGVAIIAAATPFQEAVEQDRVGFGFLAKALLDALRSDSHNVGDLAMHLNSHLDEVTKNTDYKQTAEVLLSGDDFELAAPTR